MNDTDYKLTPYKGKNPKLNIKGVEVSVYPDIIVKDKYRNQEYVGAMKIHISKNGKFEEESSKYISAVIQSSQRNIYAKEKRLLKTLFVYPMTFHRHYR